MNNPTHKETELSLEDLLLKFGWAFVESFGLTKSQLADAPFTNYEKASLAKKEAAQSIKDLMLDILDNANPMHDQNWYWKMHKEIEAL